MENDELKFLWKQIRFNNGFITTEQAVSDTVKTNKHTGIILKVVKEIKLEILLSAIILIIYSALMAYQAIILHLELLPATKIILLIPGAILIYYLISRTIRLKVYKHTTDELPVSDFCIKLSKRILIMRIIDNSVLVLFITVIMFKAIFEYLHDMGGFQNFRQSILNNPVIMIMTGIMVVISFSLYYFAWIRHHQEVRGLLDKDLTVNE